MSTTPCTLEDLCQKVNCLDADLQTIWNDTYGLDEQVYVATGNVGIPTIQAAAGGELLNTDNVYADDSQEYMRGASLISSLNPKGVFLTGDSNFDITDRLGAVSYNLNNQASKIYSGFGGLLISKKLFPVMGDLDYWIAYDKLAGTIEDRMNDTYLRLFSYLPDAKRYYSVYDEKSNTEFYILSSGRYTDYADGDTGLITEFIDDSLVGGDQYNWLVQRTASTPAKNKVVIFHHPFVAVSDVFKGVPAQGAANVFPDFALWDFQAMGVKLIVTGHTGFPTHFRKSSINIVNASAFCRSRNSLISVGDNTEPPALANYNFYGEPGYSLEYFSRQPMGETLDNTNQPAGFYVIPKNEFFRMRCSRSGIICEFVSYNPYETSLEGTVASMNVEHSFEISANQ